MPRFISAVLKRPLGLHPTTHKQAHLLGPQTEILCHILFKLISDVVMCAPVCSRVCVCVCVHDDVNLFRHESLCFYKWQLSMIF